LHKLFNLDGVTSVVQGLMVWKQFVVLSMIDKVYGNNTFEKFLQEAEVKYGLVRECHCCWHRGLILLVFDQLCLVLPPPSTSSCT